MPVQKEAKQLKQAIRYEWPEAPSRKAQNYFNRFFDRQRIKAKIVAKVEGNYGTYTVSVEAKGKGVQSACSCYIGGDGGCHHCHALGLTYLEDPDSFQTVIPQSLGNVQTLGDVSSYLSNVTLDELLKRLKTQGITQKAFAESIKMSPRHLGAIKSSEQRNRYFHELGATKLACLWVLEHCKKE